MSKEEKLSFEDKLLFMDIDELINLIITIRDAIAQSEDARGTMLELYQKLEIDA